MKKDPETLEKELPKIKQEFIQTMVEKYGDTPSHAEEISESFLRIFQDASNYSFSRNHSIPYSYIGYISAWLRYYYPLEFLTSAFIVFKDDQDKVNRLSEYAKMRDIELRPAKFRYSKGEYYFNKQTNTIYNGVGVIKDNNVETGDILHELRNNLYDSFVDFLVELKDDFEIEIVTSDRFTRYTWKEIYNQSEAWVEGVDKVFKKWSKQSDVQATVNCRTKPINRTKMLSLIRLGYFEEFGKNKKLEQVFMEFDKVYNAKLKTLKTKWQKYHQLVEFEKQLENESNAVYTQCEYELYYLGKCVTQNENISDKYIFIESLDNVGKTRTSARAFFISRGRSLDIKIGASKYRNVPFRENDLLEIVEFSIKPKKEKVDGVWKDHATDKELWVKEYRMIRKGGKEKK